jgi:pentatricopeptide repeat protein
MVLELLKDMAENFVKPTKQFMPAVRCLRAAGKLDAASALVAEIFPDPDSDSGQRIDEAHDDVVVVDDGGGDDDEEEEDCGDAEPLMTAWRSVHSSHPGFDVNAFCRAIREWNPQVEEMLQQESIQWESSLVTEILRRMRCLRSAWKFFFWLKNKAFFRHDSYTTVLLIRRILKSTIETERKENLIRELFERMRKDGMVFTVPMFNLVMRHFVRMGEAEKALNMLKLAGQFEVEPNDISYRLVIQGFAKDREGKKATRLLEEMEGKGFTLDDEARAEMITCLSLAGKIERAYALFTSSWEASGTSASAVEWKAIMAAYARVGDNAMALQLYERMRALGIKPTQDMYELATEILRKANRLSDVQQLAQERALLKFFGGTKKALQEKLLEVLFLFMEGIQQRTKSTTATIATTGSASAPGGHSAKMQTE